MTDPLRAQWRTIQRRSVTTRPTALAARDGACPCGQPVAEDEPIVLHGSVIDEDPDGARVVDLTGAEWRCGRCVAVAV